MILGIKTEGDRAELYTLDEQGEIISEKSWESGRSLSVQILDEIKVILEKTGSIKDLTGIIIFRGPGSFTSLRIGISVANSMAHSLQIPVIGAESDTWLEDGLEKLHKVIHSNVVTPFYGAEPRITRPKK